jgi:hypothetical protein
MKVFKWVLTNSFMAFVAVNALYLERQWAQNLLLFAVWLFAILSTFAVFSEDAQKAINKKGFAVSHSISATYDLLFIAALAAGGWFVSAAVWVWQMFCESYLRGKKSESGDART